MIGETLLRNHLTKWHGRGEETQYDYYRCEGCHRIITWRAIRKGGCSCDLSNKVRPARLRWYEKLRLIFMPWWCER